MNIFADFHHGGAARGQVLLFEHRLGHHIRFPGLGFGDMIDNTIILACTPAWVRTSAGFPPSMTDSEFGISYQEFMDTDWDAVLITRVETQHLFRDLIAKHPNGKNIKRICMTGNDGTSFDWSWIPNFMCCDYLSYERAPKHLNKIYYSQELGMQYGIEYVPITEEQLHTVNCFINCWPSFKDYWQWEMERSYWGGNCPHCETHDPVSKMVPTRVYPDIWKKAEEMLPGYNFCEYGIVCKNGCLDEKDLVGAYHAGALTAHYKTYEGYGYSLLQSIACGRLVVIPKKFYRYRTAGKYLIPNQTCIETDWTAESFVEAVQYLTGNLERANRYSVSCWKTAQMLFDWELEAYRVSEFLQKLR